MEIAFGLLSTLNSAFTSLGELWTKAGPDDLNQWLEDCSEFRELEMFDIDIRFLEQSEAFEFFEAVEVRRNQPFV